MKYPKVDANQAVIVAFARDCGATVAHTHMVGNGFVDVVVGYMGINMLWEIKDGDKPPSKRKLTPLEQEFHDNWAGTTHIVESTDDVTRILDEVERREG